MVGSPEFLLVALTESQEEATGLRPTVKKRKEGRQADSSVSAKGRNRHGQASSHHCHHSEIKGRLLLLPPPNNSSPS